MPFVSSLTKSLVFALSILSLSTSLFAGTYGDLTYELNGNSATITDCDENASGELSIPAEIPGGRYGNIPVTTIGQQAFRNCSSLTSVTIPDSVTTIEEWAFHSCSSLTSVTIPESVTSIGRVAFGGPTRLTRIDVDPANLYFSSIDGVLFNKLQTTIIQYPGGSIGSYTIPDSVTAIGDDAFSDCDDLTHVTIPDSVTSIGAWAFHSCDSLTSITIPASVSTIGRNIFYYSNITSVTFNGDAPASLHSGAFSGSRFFTVYFKEDAIGFTAPEWNRHPSVMIPAALTYEVNENSVTITDCDSNASGDLIIPASIEDKPVTTIGDSAFSACSSLTSITIPDSVTSIEDSAFADCSSLTELTFNGDAPGNISLSVFDDTAVGFTVYFYESAIGFTEPTWEGYPSVALPDYLYYLYYEDNGDGITITACNPEASGKLSIPAMIEDKPVTSIGGSAFSDCSSLTSVTIPDSVTTIGSLAFSGCSSLTSVTIPDSGVTTIGNHAFLRCSSLTSVTIPDSVTTIGSYAFYGCSSLTNVTIPDSVISIENSAFYLCSSLTSLTFNGDAPSLGSYAFHYGAAGFTVYFYEDATNFTTPTWEGYLSVELSLTSDDDGDKWPNHLERLLGTSPLDGNARLKTWLSQGETGLKIHHAPYSESCEFVVESTSDLSDPESWLPVEGVSFAGDITEQTAELSPASEPALFYRISVNEIE